MANYGAEITNYYAPYRYQGKPSIVGGSGSGGKKKGAAYLDPNRGDNGAYVIPGQTAVFNSRTGAKHMAENVSIIRRGPR